MCRSAVAALVCSVVVLCSADGAQLPAACPDPLADLTSERLGEVFDGLLSTGTTVPAAVEALADFAISAAPIGARLLIDGKCHEVQQVQVAAFHEGPHGHADVEREAGEERGADIHRVASFQRRWEVEHQGVVAETWVDLSAVVAIGEADPDVLELGVAPTSLCPGESAEATATVRCGACPVAGETVSFEVTGGATVEPPAAVTDESGEARVRVTAEDGAEDAVLTAATKKLSAARSLRLGECCKYWRLDATFFYENHDRYDSVNNHWTSEATFADLALGNYVGMELCPTVPEAVLRAMRLRSEVRPGEADGSLSDVGFAVYDGGDWLTGTLTGSPRWRLQVGLDPDEMIGACDVADGASAKTVYLLFNLVRPTLHVSWPKLVGDGYLRFETEAFVEVDRLRACAPFTMEIGFDDPPPREGATLRFTPLPGR